jgi:hypothetical protein
MVKIIGVASAFFLSTFQALNHEIIHTETGSGSKVRTSSVKFQHDPQMSGYLEICMRDAALDQT